MRHLVSSMALVLALAVVAGAQEQSRPFVFGMSSPNNEEEFQAVKALGCTNVRIGGNWDLVERKRGVYDWSHGGQEEVELCAKYGMEPFFLIVATPKWALAPEKRDKPWGWPPEPEFYPDATKFYRTLAARYRGKVKYYEFWNEQNGYGWNKINAPEEYAPILKVAYKALKEGNPDCLVAVGGLDGAGWKGYTQYLQQLYELGCGDYFDAVAVHPYREDGPIDGHSLKRIHQILVSHGHGDRKLWLTEYGWSNKHGHDNKARWLKESLAMLSSPEYDFVFQASYHTHCDFNDAEYGLCDTRGKPRAAHQVFKDYPKDWGAIVEQRNKPKLKPKVAFKDDFEASSRSWKPFGAGFRIVGAQSIGVKPEQGQRVLTSGSDERYRSGGAYLQVPVPGGVPVRLSARVLSVHGGGAAGPCRVGIDPLGGTNADAESVIWSRALETHDAWDTLGVGQGAPIHPKAKRVTLFLRYDWKGKARAPRVFDEIEFVAREDTFKLPTVEPIAD